MDKGFELNPYERCVADKMMNSKQCSLVCNVDNNKVSHMEAKVVEYSINYLKNSFGELVVTGGNNHTFLGININIMEDKEVEIETKNIFLEEIGAFGEHIDEKVTTPESSHLLIFNGQAQKLDE